MVMRGFHKGLCLLAMVMLVALWARPSALAEDKPHYGGELRVALAGDPPSLDMHQEQTFMVTIPMSTVYNTLVMFDPHQYPKIIGDLAQACTIRRHRFCRCWPILPTSSTPRSISIRTSTGTKRMPWVPGPLSSRSMSA